ncbi:MAG: GAF domain-containing sensor histidine kinase [Ardenticatenia bacterium]|nr:GAF domain-containing sensor histidine kinase [Ardenticatenia bacterium]
MNRLPRRIHVLRWLLPAVAFVAVLIHQTLEHTVLRSLPWAWHFVTQLLFYGLAGPLVVWSMLTWIVRSVEAQDRATKQLAALYTFSHHLATASDDRLLDIIVRFPAQVLDGVVGCTLTLFDERSGTATLEAAWGLDRMWVHRLRQGTCSQERYRRCSACTDLRATFSTSRQCPALPSELAQETPARSVICLPLGRGTKRLGHLNVYLESEAPPPEDTVQLLNTLAAEAAPAIEAARLRNQELAAFYHVDQTLRCHLDLDGMLRQIAQDAVEACRADGALILLREEGESSLRVRVAVPEGFTLEAVQAMGELVTERQAPVRIADLNVSQNGDGRHAATAMPMAVGDEVIGVLCLVHAPSRELSERQVRLLSAIASQTALIVQNARFYARLEGYAMLEERARLAREIHDGLAQGLGYLHIKVQSALRRLRQSRLSDAIIELEEMRTVIQELYTEARAAIDGLRAPFDPQKSFSANLRAYVHHVVRRSGLNVRLYVPNEELDVPPVVAAHVFRIVQEGLNNIIKHAKADRATVWVECNAYGLVVTIEDNGRGFDPTRTSSSAHFGLHIMRERAEALGGHLHIRSEVERGTVITLHLPAEHLRTPTEVP